MPPKTDEELKLGEEPKEKSGTSSLGKDDGNDYMDPKSVQRDFAERGMTGCHDY